MCVTNHCVTHIHTQQWQIVTIQVMLAMVRHSATTERRLTRSSCAQRRYHNAPRSATVDTSTPRRSQPHEIPRRGLVHFNQSRKHFHDIWQSSLVQMTSRPSIPEEPNITGVANKHPHKRLDRVPLGGAKVLYLANCSRGNAYPVNIDENTEGVIWYFNSSLKITWMQEGHM